jgi:predicted acetyltransferase
MEYTYKVITTEYGSEVIKRTDSEGNEAWIPTDPANSDYAEYLAFLESQPKKTTATKTTVVEEPVAPEEE